MKRIITDIDLQLNRIYNLRLEELKNDPQISSARLWYNSSESNFKASTSKEVVTILDSRTGWTSKNLPSVSSELKISTSDSVVVTWKDYTYSSNGVTSSEGQFKFPISSATSIGLLTGADYKKFNDKVSFPGFGTTHITAAYGDHNHSGVYEPVFTKNTAFNKNFGTKTNTVCQGNDVRLSDTRDFTEHALTTEDLDEVKVPGFYFAAGSNAVKNNPFSSGTAFGLKVYKSASGYVTQEISGGTAPDGSFRMRTNTGTAWTQWCIFYNSVNPGPLASASQNGLLSADIYKYISRVRNVSSQTNLTCNFTNSLNLISSLTANASLTASGLNAGEEGFVLVKNTGSSLINLTLPNTGNYISIDGTIIAVAASSSIEISIKYIDSKYRIKVIN